MAPTEGWRAPACPGKEKRSRRRVPGSVLGLTEIARRDRSRAPHRGTEEADVAHGSALAQRIERALVSPTEPMPSFMRLPPERFRALVAFLTLATCTAGWGKSRRLGAPDAAASPRPVSHRRDVTVSDEWD